MRAARLLACLAVVAPLAAARAQPTRYPRPPVDDERAREQRSLLWDAATHPAQAPYAAALDEAKRKLELKDFAGAAHVAEHAIALVPEAPDAYDVRGRAYLGLHDWPRCAADLAAALGRTRQGRPVRPDLRADLAACQARAGQLVDSEVTYADAIALTTSNRDLEQLWLRLGEVRVALGKLDEAIAAYDAAVATAASERREPAAIVLWQRAAAYDRARQPSKAEEDVRLAIASDRNRSQIDNGALPLLGTGEREFLYGVAYRYAERPSDQPTVESALLYFRRFVALAPQSPWRRRAEEHVRDLAPIPLPDVVRRVSGNAPLDADATAKSVRAAIPHLRACLAKLPATLVEVRITRSGPRATPGPLERVRFHAPLPGVQITPILPLDNNPAELDAAVRCLEGLGEKLALPPVKEKETYYQIAFAVVAP